MKFKNDWFKYFHSIIKMTQTLKDPDKSFDYMKTVKTSLAKVVVDESSIPIIEELVQRVNKITIQTYQYIKLYFLYLFENNIKFPLIDEKFISDVIAVITVRYESRGITKNE